MAMYRVSVEIDTIDADTSREAVEAFQATVASGISLTYEAFEQNVGEAAELITYEGPDEADAALLLAALRAVLPYAESRAEDMEDCADAMALTKAGDSEARAHHAKAVSAVDNAKALLARLEAGKPAAADDTPTGFDRWIEQAQDRKDGDTARRMIAERRMAVALVDRALRDGYAISIHDGEDYCLRMSNDRAAILAALSSSDEDTIRLRQQDGGNVGWFKFIYGNSGWDVVSDHSDNPICNAIWKETLEPIADEIEAGK